MASIASLDDLVARLTGGSSGTPETIWFHKSARVAGAAPTAPVAGRPCSLWRHDGQPAAGATPGAVAIPDNTTDGGLKQTDPGGGREKWLHSAWCSGLVAGSVLIYDRLLHIGGLSGTTITAQTVGGTLTRNTGGVGNFMFAEIYTAIGATGRTITASYTNTTPTAGRTSAAVVIGGTGFLEQTRAILMPLQAGDIGVQAVASVTLSASTGTAGNFGVTVGRPICLLSIPGNGVAGGRSWAQGLPGLPKIDTDACLAMLWFPNSVTIPELFGCMSFVEA